MFNIHDLGQSFDRLHKENAFGFIDADNMKVGFDQCLKRAGITEDETKLFDFNKLFWPFGLKRHFLYSAIESGKSPPGWISSLRSQSGFLFRETLLKTVNGKRKQEGVDVRLAVEAMQFAFRGKMSHAIIFSGDGDLLPLVNALVDEGVITAVVSFGSPEMSEVASRLRDKADGFLQITREELSECLAQEHSWSSAGGGTPDPSAEVLEKMFTKGGKEFLIQERGSNGLFSILERRGEGSTYKKTTFRSLEGAKAWFKLKHAHQ
ncbi:NYN domain-containing protein [Leisingera caerulea]|uniref:NYN domain-containing protein n=1 Tax=Leisingera caerulea TaxID=506591 RepID=UPI003F4A9DB4